MSDGSGDDGPPPDEDDYGDEEEGEDEEGEEEDDDFDLAPNHPLLARAQNALKKQLNEQRARVEEALKDRSEDLRVTNANLWFYLTHIQEAPTISDGVAHR
jgi:hypothetical protein